MILTSHSWPAKVMKSGLEEGTPLTVGQSIKVETAPNGVEILNAECPVGKAWSVRIIVEITETDAT